MSRKRGLTKRQLALLEDLFVGELDEHAILDKYNVSENLYNKWLADDRFIEQYSDRIARAYRQSELIIAKYAPLAAAKLVQLTESDKAETARKACLDILSLPTFAGRNTVTSTDSAASGPLESGQLSAETASRLLAALAEEQDGKGG